jgi:hypothetical protein
MKLAGLFALATVAAAGPAMAAHDDETFEPEIQDIDTPLDFPYNPPPATETYDQTGDDYGAPQGDGAGYSEEAGYTDGYDDGYTTNAYQSFEDPLAPYGSWIAHPLYGQVWVPAVAIVGANFIPYATAGHFTLTEYGWTWVSDYPWGWAPFHYGRWIILAGYGWCWIPGTMWGPAWVTWRVGDGYVGWAPLPPRGVNISITTPWRFVPQGDLGTRRPRTLAPHLVQALFKRTKVISNHRVLGRGEWTTHVNAGPTRLGRAAPVRLSEIAPASLPRQAIVPRANPAFRRGTAPAIAGGGVSGFTTRGNAVEHGRPLGGVRSGVAPGAAPAVVTTPYAPRIHGAAPPASARPVAPTHLFRGSAGPQAPRTFTPGAPPATHFGNPGGAAQQFRGGAQIGGARPGPR